MYELLGMRAPARPDGSAKVTGGLGPDRRGALRRLSDEMCILAEEGDELLIMDQHGAHERVLHEKLLEDLGGPGV